MCDVLSIIGICMLLFVAIYHALGACFSFVSCVVLFHLHGLRLGTQSTNPFCVSLFTIRGLRFTECVVSLRSKFYLFRVSFRVSRFAVCLLPSMFWLCRFYVLVATYIMTFVTTFFESLCTVYYLRSTIYCSLCPTRGLLLAIRCLLPTSGFHLLLTSYVLRSTGYSLPYTCFWTLFTMPHGFTIQYICGVLSNTHYVVFTMLGVRRSMM